jgi:putative ABC transport system substrate-binding protein
MRDTVTANDLFRYTSSIPYNPPRSGSGGTCGGGSFLRVLVQPQHGHFWHTHSNHQLLVFLAADPLHRTRTSSKHSATVWVRPDTSKAATWQSNFGGRLNALAAELVARKPAVIFAGAVDVRIRALNKELSAFPIVFATGGDPVSLGLAASLGRPGGHTTGATVISAILWPKRLELLRELIGPPGVVAVLVNPDNATTDPATKAVEAAAKDVGQRIILVNVTAESEFDSAFAKIATEHANGLLVADDAIFQNGREKLVALARRHAIPAIYGRREFTSSGGLMSYGASTADQYRQSGLYVGRILAGAKPGELPFLQPTKFEIVINLKTAKALGVTMPKTLLTAADEVIE